MTATTAVALVASTFFMQSSEMNSNTAIAPDEIHVEDYWKYFTKNSLSTRVIFTTLCVLTFVVGVVGNTLVVATVVRDKKMHSVTNYFIVNLAISDFLVLIFCVPASVVPVYLYGWHLGSALCKFIPFIQCVTISVSVNSMAAISFDRYLAICQVFEFYVTRNMARMMIIGLWIIASVIFIPLLVTYRIKEADEMKGMQTCIQLWPSILHEWIYFLSAEFILSFTLPLLIATAFYSMIAYRVWFRPLLGAGTSVSVIQKSKIRALRMIVAVLLLFAVCWFPLHVFIICLYVLPNIETNEMLLNLAFYIKWLALSNSAINPIVYFLFSNKYRRGFKDICTGCRSPIDGRQSTYSRSQGLPKKQVLYRSQTSANRISNVLEDTASPKKKNNLESIYKDGMELLHVDHMENVK